MHVGAVPFGFYHRVPPGSGRNRRYAGACRKRRRIPGAGCGTCVAGRRGRGTLRGVAEASGCLPDHTFGRNGPVGIVACRGDNMKIYTFRRMLSCSVAAARTRVSLALRARFDTSADPSTGALPIDTLPLRSRWFRRRARAAETIRS